jgi:hypothetical protein
MPHRRNLRRRILLALRDEQIHPVMASGGDGAREPMIRDVFRDTARPALFTALANGVRARLPILCEQQVTFANWNASPCGKCQWLEHAILEVRKYLLAKRVCNTLRVRGYGESGPPLFFRVYAGLRERRGGVSVKELAGVIEWKGPNFFLDVKLYAVEIGSTLVFVVFIGVETVKAIRHLIESVRED